MVYLVVKEAQVRREIVDSTACLVDLAHQV